MTKEYSLGNRHFELYIDGERGCTSRLVNRFTGDDYLKSCTAAGPMYKLYCIDKETGEKVEVLPESVVNIEEGVAGDRSSLAISFDSGRIAGTAEAPANIGATVNIDAADDDPESLWTIEIRNEDERYKVVEVLFPYFRGFYLGETWEDDVIIYPHHAGERTLAPVREYTTERYLGFGRGATTRGKDGVFSREINYCGLASMDWMYYYDDRNGFYLASYDKDFLVTGLRVETGGPDDPWMGWGLRKYVVVKQGETWRSNPSAVAITTKDWHWGARRYRKWIDGIIEMPDNPEYLKDETILNQCYNFKRNGVIFNRFSDIPSMYDAGRLDYGMRHMFIASWNRSGFDQDYPEYQPDMELGTPWQLAEGCRYVNENEGFVTFYINSRIFHVKSDFFDTLGKKWAMKDHAGEMYHEVYGPHEFVVLCPSNKEWQDYLIEMGSWMVRSYGAKGIYLDQLGSAEPFPCYDPDHTHSDIGRFNQGYLRVLKELLARIRGINEDSFLMIENCGDIYGSYVWGSLTWNGEDYDEFYNLFKYTFPEYVQVNMCNPKRHLEGEARACRLHKDLNRALLLGSVFWVGLEKTATLEDELHAYLKAAITLRNRLNPFFKRGTFVDDEGIVEKPEGMEVVHWRLDGGGDLYIISNPERVEGGVLATELPEGGIEGVRYFDIDGNEGAIEYRRGSRGAAEIAEISLPKGAGEVLCIIAK
ncbi:MAG TPA: DUF6259 domain-containing protein [Bacillota bacterium]|nr:DUF6259 domain-containing protein [Bacillota bacterium]